MIGKINMKGDLPFSLSMDQIQDNYNRLMEKIKLMFEDRYDLLKQMYDDYDEELVMAPGSSIEHYHNAFPGGYIDHVLRVLDYSFEVYFLWKN